MVIIMQQTYKLIRNIFILLLLIFLLLYIKSFFPKQIDSVYNGYMFPSDAYLFDNVDDLSLQVVKVSINGKLHKTWFRKPYFEGYVDVDVAPIDQGFYRATYIANFGTEHNDLHYYYYENKLKTIEYATSAFLTKDMKQIYLELSEFTGYEGYSVFAPASNVEDLKNVQEYYQKIYLR